MPKKLPFKNLAFQGGGAKTFAYHGALPALEEQGVLKQIERVVGTSAGAMLAAVVSFRLGAAETMAIYGALDFSQMPGSANSRSEEPLSRVRRLVEPGWNKAKSNVDAINRLARKYGWYPNNYDSYGYQWMAGVIAGECEGNGRATFAEFRARGFRDLHVIATNISTHEMAVFCAEKTPDVAVVDALLMSQSIPLYFEALQFDGRQFGSGDYYADGGIVNNYPIHIFDDPRFAAGNRWFIHGVNWETLGLRLYTPEACPDSRRPITNVVSYVGHMFEALFDAQEVTYKNNQADQLRTINISNCCVSTIDLAVRPVPGNPKYDEMVLSGYDATQAYLETYQRPWLNVETGLLREIRQGIRRMAVWRKTK
ncbi:MAG: patatin-like phospholipase family protein [Chloroflexi bacterium]|nr:patatin-like phospholipase family protein [Chloroflexota bacterium]